MSKEATIYLDRDNKARVGIRENNKPIEGGIVTKVSIELPDRAFVGGTPQELSTDTEYMSLSNNETEFNLDFTGLPLEAGKHPARVTVYDASTSIGYAWGSIVIDVSNWDF